ncbi:hypothetical protein UPYG_G00291290 [Umbra pygmaea]|uniref:Microtubule-associated protein 4 n=1 Tax=Umbra pygmaea TaxID=75934 RepID=A0ABD0WKS9_UMBPY
MDLSLRDALTDGVPQSGPESLVKRDFMASLEKEAFEDKVGETVGKTEYRPLLDGKDGKGSSMMPGGQIGMQRQEPMGEKRPCPTGQSSPFSAEYLSGFSQPGMMSMNMGSGSMGGLAPFQTGMPPTGNPQKAFEPPKQSQSPFKPSDSYPSTQYHDNSAEVWTNPNPWTGVESGPQASEGLRLSPSNSVEESPNSDPLSPHGSHSQETCSGDDRGNQGFNGGSKQQKRKKKRRRPREEVYDFLDRQEAAKEEKGAETESGASDGPLSPSSPSKDESWECEIRGRGGGRVRGRKNKSRMKIPEEWGAPAQEPTAPHATPASVALESAMITASGHLSSTLENISSLIADPQTNPFTSHVLASPPLTENPKTSAVVTTDPAHTDTSTSHLNMLEHPSPAKVGIDPPQYEPMCIDDFKMATHSVSKEPLSPSKGEAKSTSDGRGEAVASVDQRQLDPPTSPGLSPQVSQTFSFLDSVLQTPPAGTPASQPQSHTTTPQGPPPDTSLHSTPPPLRSHSSQPDPDTPSPHPAEGTGLNPSAPPFIPTALPLTEHQEPPLPEPPLLEGW